MYRCAVGVVIAFWSLLASAEDWQVVSVTQLGQLRLNKASVSKAGIFTAAVLVYEFKDLQKLTSPPYAVFNKRQDDVQVDCSNPSLGILTSNFFEGDKLVSKIGVNAPDVKHKPSEAGTMAATVVQAVCAAAPN